MTAIEKIVEFGVPILAAFLAGVAKWVHTMAAKIEEHDEHIREIRKDQTERAEACHDTRERIALTEQGHAHLREAIQELRHDIRLVLQHIRMHLPGQRGRGEE